MSVSFEFEWLMHVSPVETVSEIEPGGKKPCWNEWPDSTRWEKAMVKPSPR